MSGFLDSAGRSLFQLGFQCSPIILTGGIASQIPGGLLPIVTITQAASFVSGLLSGASPSLDDFFAHFKPLPGTTLVDNQFGQYPFASQVVAANSIIKQPLRVSLLMTCPARGAGSLTAKLVTFEALQAVLDQHHSRGGTYTVATPSYLYTNCLLAGLRDVGSESKQVQVNWQWDFEQPLITLAQAEQVQNGLMNSLSIGTPNAGLTSGLSQSVGVTGSGAGPATIGSASSLTGATLGDFGSVSTPTGTALA